MLCLVKVSLWKLIYSIYISVLIIFNLEFDLFILEQTALLAGFVRNVTDKLIYGATKELPTRIGSCSETPFNLVQFQSNLEVFLNFCLYL